MRRHYDIMLSSHVPERYEKLNRLLFKVFSFHHLLKHAKAHSVESNVNENIIIMHIFMVLVIRWIRNEMEQSLFKPAAVYIGTACENISSCYQATFPFASTRT